MEKVRCTKIKNKKCYEVIEDLASDCNTDTRSAKQNQHLNKSSQLKERYGLSLDMSSRKWLPKAKAYNSEPK